MQGEIEQDRSFIDLEWPRLCAHIAERTSSDLGRARALSLAPADDRDTAELRLSVMAELLELARAGMTLPAAMIEDTSGVVARLERGGVASQSELASLRRLLRQTVELLRFGQSHQQGSPLVAQLLDVSEELPPLLRELSELLDDEGQLRDDASPGLSQARAEVRTLRTEMKRRVDDLIRRYREALQDAYFAERDGRYVLPVRADAPFRVEGIVLGTSASGSTLYVEPKELAQIGNRLGLAEGEVERQIALLLAQISQTLRPHAEELAWAEEVCVRADLLAACTTFSVDVNARVVPFGEAGALSLKAARHPLLCLSEIPVVPSDLRVSSERGLVLSGPNAGGKTVALKTLGLCALLQASGLPIPAEEGSWVGFFDEVLCDIGDDQSLSMSLSTFSGHVRRVQRILEDAAQGTLVLFDELMGGTDPDEGAVLAIATIDELVSAGAAVCVTTHYEPLKNHAARVSHLENGAVGFDFERMEPTFVVDMGRPGASSALVVAQRHGLPSYLTERAEKLLPEILAKKRVESLDVEESAVRFREETKKLEASREEQERLNRRLEREVEKLKEQRMRALERDGDELRAEIREARAELRRIRKQMGKVGASELRHLEDQVDGLAGLTRLGGKIEQAKKEQVTVDQSADLAALKVGERVRIVGFDSEAEVLEAPKKGKVKVLLGVMKMSVALTQIQSKVRARSQPQKSQPQKSTPSRTFRDVKPDAEPAPPVRSEDVVLDLRGRRVEESLLMVDQFVDELLRRPERGGFVLHGHGTGALKEAVRSHLRSHSCVQRSRPAERDEGGDAFTVFWLAS